MACLPVCLGASYTAYRAQFLHEPILFSFSLVPLAVFLYAILASAWWGAAALIPALLTSGHFYPRNSFLSSGIGLILGGFWVAIQEVHTVSDFAAFYSFIAAPALGWFLFSRTEKTRVSA